jgi:molecular chaperone DnaJ
MTFAREFEMKKKKRKDYYTLLNVEPDAGPSAIRKAYRKAAKKYHPDVSTRNGETFKQVQEAYETLSDPEKKTTYDQELSSKNVPPPRPQGPIFRSDFSFGVSDDTDRFFSDLDDFWLGVVPDFFARRERRPKEQSVEITLTPEEARKGGEITLDIPFWKTCSSCRGTGRLGGPICSRCRGEGEERSEGKAVVTIPRRAIDGMRTRIPVDLPGMRIDLVVTVRVRH